MPGAPPVPDSGQRDHVPGNLGGVPDGGRHRFDPRATEGGRRRGPAPILAAWQKLHETPLYDLLYTYVIFGANVFYMLAIASVFVLRIRRPDLPRPYRTFGYPLTPLLYVAAALLLLGNMLSDSKSRGQSLAGLGIILLGVPAYWLFRRSGSGVRSGDTQYFPGSQRK